MADALPQMVWVADSAGRIIYCNKRYHEYTGSTLADLKRNGIRPHLHPEDIQRIDSAWERSLSTGVFYRTEYRLRNKLGEFRWHMGMAQPYYNEDGKIERWFGTVTEIHHLKVPEAASDLCRSSQAGQPLALS